MPGLIEIPALIISSLATTTLAANALYLGTYALAYAGLAFGATALQGLFVKKPDVPTPEDGNYNLKQAVPSLAYVLGRAKKGSDYVFLEEADGTAYHILVWAGHQINGFVQHYLHDEAVTLDVNGLVVTPSHFVVRGSSRVSIHTRVGFPVSTVYSDIAIAFASIWNSDFRGDGLATVRMACETVSSEDYMGSFPNQMPQHSAIGEGALLYDPRSGITAFSTNLALMRLWHLTNPVGGKMALADMYLPDWVNAANVCDEFVTNRLGETERRYHGGFWFRAENDPVEVGRIMDQAGELVVYERPDGLIGVHAGKYVDPDIRLTASAIISCAHDVNQRRSSTVLAVRGQWTDPANRYNTVDAAIYGDPYIGEDTERSATIENQAVQSHNHMQRLQKITYTRKNAARLTIKAHYSDAKNVPYRRFVRIHYPPRLNEVVVEITEAPKISLRNMTVEFSGIIVPSTLYNFNAAIEEGAPGANAIILPPGSVPSPVNFNVVIQNEVIAGGSTAAYALATWNYISDSLIYELEWEPTSGSEPARSVNSKTGELSVRSNYLSDGVQYRFRLRSWSNGKSSAWTSYEIRTATADPTAPGVVSSVAATGGAGQIAFSWVAPNSANYAAARIYTNTTNSMTGATLRRTEYGPPATADSFTVTGLSAGTYYGFVEAINASGVAATAVATGAKTVT
ncbi:hypothetical protein [Rhizobium grahamii]|uniref:Fibronectin type-III domain-containing protein n=1 Tax=Rhizobium grahamii CCGE 502 TaxID=990285 RepID=S3HBV5_9HYPH|nr:hypothetical protein [Rhizobium grahamii]EPE95705.1 hypothetical protein RGCCGE502_22685 [Rhizobium grahamii CCGE 502]